MAAIKQDGISKTEIEGKIKLESKAIKTLENGITSNITALISGEITQDEFLSKKETINNTIAGKNAELLKLQNQLKALLEGKGTVDKRLSELRPLLIIEKLDRELVDLLIDKILIHGENEIEIAWLDEQYGGK